MFDARSAFMSLQDREFTLKDLRSALEQLRVVFLQDLPAEITTDHLLELAIRERWVKEEAHGRIRIEVPA